MPTLAPRYRREHFAKLREQAKAIMYEAKSAPCMDCGVSYHPYVMDFDHREGKKFNVSEWWHKSSSLDTLRAEMAKCDVVCSNCHRLRTLKTLGKKAVLGSIPRFGSGAESEIVTLHPCLPRSVVGRLCEEQHVGGSIPSDDTAPGCGCRETSRVWDDGVVVTLRTVNPSW